MARPKKIPPELRDLRLRQLEEHLAEFVPLSHGFKPRRGWIRSIREALGMETKQLAERARLNPSTVSELEKRESIGSITLGSLQRLADAMDAELVYAIVPRQPLSDLRAVQAQRRASQIVGSVDYTMALEAQAVDGDAQQRQRSELAGKMLREWSAELWDDL